MKRIKIFEDTESIETWKKNREKLNELINQFSEEFQKFGVTLNSKLFVEFDNKAGDMVYGVLEGQIQKEMIDRPNVYRAQKENFDKHITEQIKPFIPLHKKIRAALSTCGMAASDVTITRGNPEITEENIERKREELTTYVETEIQLELWQLQEKLSKTLNRLEEFNKKNNLRSIFRTGSPDNLTDYLLFEIIPGSEIPPLGGMFPLEGGMICKPNHDNLRDLDPEKPELKKTGNDSLIKQIKQLSSEGLTQREISAKLDISLGAVNKYINN